MDFKTVQSGDALNIPAATYNAFIDAAIAQRQGRSQPRPATPAQQRNTGVVWVQNRSGAALAQYACVQIDRPIVLPAESAQSEADFRQRIGLQVIKPTAARLCWAILQEPLEVDAIGQAVIDGITIAKINLLATSHKSVDSDPAGVIPKSTTAGPGQIAWVAGGAGTATASGEQWAVLRLTASAAALPIGQKVGQGWFTVADNQGAFSLPFSVDSPI
jgi:hypothetical protein